MTHRVEPLREDHDLEAFDCGNAPLTDWLKRHALHTRGQGTRTYVLVDGESGSVVGYFAIAPHVVAREGTPARIGHGAPRQIPAILLAKLALDRRLHGKGLGSELLIKALETIVDAARAAGGKLVVVDAIDDAAVAFYEHHDFEALAADPLRLVKKLSAVAKALGLTWP